MWMLSGFAGGIQPWYHHVGAYSEDARAYLTAEPIMKWHKANEQYLVNRKPIANVGIAWSQRNTDYYGRDNAEELVETPWRGFTQAMVRARIPYLPIHIDNVDRDGGNLSVLILSNIGAMSDQQISSVRKFVDRGGSLIASGPTSLYNERGDPRPDLALADLFGVSGAQPRAAARGVAGARGAAGARAGGGAATSHTYLRLTPELRAAAYGPKSGAEPAAAGTRHPILAGFDATDILEFGGTLSPLKVDPKAQVLMSFIPAFPTYPPETAYMRTPRTDIPGLVVNESNNRRVAYLAADIDRRYAVDLFPDHGDLLANLVRWAARDTLPLDVKGAGLIDCELYQQPGRLILHLLNVTSSGTWRAPIDELIPIGPLQVRVRVPAGMSVKSIKTLVSGKLPTMTIDSGIASFEIPSILDHEVVVLES
jgi:hypothetical protein